MVQSDEEWKILEMLQIPHFQNSQSRTVFTMYIWASAAGRLQFWNRFKGAGAEKLISGVEWF